MLRNVRRAAITLGALALTAGGAKATSVPAGTLSVAVLGSPTVNTSLGTVQFTSVAAYFSGGGAFTGFVGTGNLSTTTFSFSETLAGLVSYSANPITSFFTFSGNDGDFYTFNLDQNIITTAYSYTAGSNGNGAIALYILGDLTATGSTPYSTPTPTAFTLTLNETGGSAWSASATLANPPPGTNVPEPASLLVLGSGLVGMGVFRRRKRR